MRLSRPSSILTRLEYVAAVRRMLWAHGFGLTCLERTDEDDYASETDSVSDDEDDDHDRGGAGGQRGDEDEDSWRRAKAIVVAHSFGTEAAAWLLRDAVRGGDFFRLLDSGPAVESQAHSYNSSRRPTSSPARSSSTR